MGALDRRLKARLRDESGQTMLLVILAMGIFLLGAVAFGVDITNLWFHRQAAQTAADAACTAGAMDLLYDAEDEPAPAASSGSWAWIPQNNLNCSGHSSSGSSMYSPCWYASQNGYSSGGLATGSASNAVMLNSPTAPTSVAGVPTCSSSFSGSVCIPTFISNPLLQVNVEDRVKVYFMGMINGAQTSDVGAQATCGVLESLTAVPLLVLDPRNETSFTSSGSFTIDIYGGPTRSIQVNSSSNSAVTINGAAGSIDLSKGGPSDSGSDFGITGAQPSVSDLSLGSTGHYIAPDSPMSDPFAMVCAPGQSTDCLTTSNGYAAPATPAAAAPVTTVGGGTDGCPSTATCSHYQPGSYANGISIGNGKAGTANTTAVFDPGLYYIMGGMSLGSNSQVCTGTNVGDGSGGVTFYFADGNSISVAANSGGGQCLNASGNPLTANDIKCTASSVLPGNMPASTVLSGNILLAPCTGYYGDPLGTNDPQGEQRGMLFFQDRSASASPQWGGGGAFTLAGSMYFHYCDSSVAGGGENCNNTSGYTTQLTLGGGSCSGTYIEGDLVTDQLYLHGNPCFNMDLDPSATYYTLKASLLQ